MVVYLLLSLYLTIVVADSDENVPSDLRGIQHDQLYPGDAVAQLSQHISNMSIERNADSIVIPPTDQMPPAPDDGYYYNF